MLDYLRQSSGSWVAKILFALLILSFSAWGIGDILQTRVSQAPAISVGSLDVSLAYVQERFMQGIDRARSMSNSELTYEQAKAMGFLDLTLKAIVEETAVDMAAKNGGVLASDEAVRTFIMTNPAFQGADGLFDRALFRRILERNGLSEASYIAMLKPELVRQRYAQAVAANGFAPKSLADLLYRYDNETREAQVLFIASKDLSPGKPNDEADLRRLYEDHVDQFAIPENRTLSAVVLSAEETEKHIRIEEADLAAYYEDNRDDFLVPERRVVSQVVADNEEKAQQIVEQVRSGVDFAVAAKNAKAGPPVAIGSIGPESLPPEAADAVFSLDEAGVADPVQSSFGWHVFLTTAIEEPHVRPFESVKNDIRVKIVRERALDVLNAAASKIEDALAAGASLEDVAKDYGADVLRGTEIYFDSAPAVFPERNRRAIVTTGFSLLEGEVSRPEHAEDSLFLVRVDAITPATSHPFEQVRPQLVEMWRARARQEMAEETARKTVEKAQGKPLDAFVPKSGAVLYNSAIFDRKGTLPQKASVLERNLESTLFALKEEELAWKAIPEGAVVLRLKKIVPANPAAHPSAVTALASQIADDVGQDLTRATFQGYAHKFGAKVNRALIDQSI